MATVSNATQYFSALEDIPKEPNSICSAKPVVFPCGAVAVGVESANNFYYFLLEFVHPLRKYCYRGTSFLDNQDGENALLLTARDHRAMHGRPVGEVVIVLDMLHGVLGYPNRWNGDTFTLLVEVEQGIWPRGIKSILGAAPRVTIENLALEGNEVSTGLIVDWRNVCKM